jgi:hypothetical protein
MLVCKCCMKSTELECAAIAEDKEDVPPEGAEEIKHIFTGPKHLQIPVEVPPIVAAVEEEPTNAETKVEQMIPESEKATMKPFKFGNLDTLPEEMQSGDDTKVTEEKSTKDVKKPAKEALMRLCVDEKENQESIEISSAPPRPTEPKSKLKAAVAKLLEPKKVELPVRPRQKPAPPRPMTPPIVKQYKPLTDFSCSGMSIEEVRLAKKILKAKIEHDKKMVEWNAFVQMENKKDMTIIQKRRVILRERREMN